MTACINQRDLHRARQLISELDSLVSYNVTTELRSALYGAYVSGLIKINDKGGMSQATRALEDMKRLNLSMDTATMNSYVQGLCTCQPHRIQEAIDAVRKMAVDGPRPDSFTYSILFKALGRQGYEESALQFYRSLKSPLDGTAINSLLRSFLTCSDPLKAVKIFEQLSAHNHSSGAVEYFVPTKITYTILFTAIARALSPDKTIQVDQSTSEQLLVLNTMEAEDDGISSLVDGKESKNEISTVGLSPSKCESIDALVRRLFSEMRFEYDLEVDDVMLSVLNTLFSIKDVPANRGSKLSLNWIFSVSGSSAGTITSLDIHLP